MVQLDAYLGAVTAFQEVKICTVDSWGNEVYTALDKELQRQRQWMVCARCEYPARRMLASLLTQRTATTCGSDAEAARRLLLDASDHLRAAAQLASEDAQRKETATELDKVEGALKSLPVPLA
eukprot:427155-Prymnesium_polylepis.1